MTARTILAGLVAILGISTTTWSEIGRGLDALHGWTAARLAAWDAPARVDFEAISLPTAPAVIAPGFRPITPVDQALGIAYELNRAAEGMDGRAPAGAARRPGGPEEAGQRPERPGLEMSAWSGGESLESMVIATVWQRLERETAAARAAVTPPRLPSSRVFTPRIACRFSASRPVFSAGERGSTPPLHVESSIAGRSRRIRIRWTRPTPRPDEAGRSRARFEPIEPVHESGIVRELNRLADGIEGSSTGTSVQGMRPRGFEPIIPGIPPEIRLAEEFNRQSDGLEPIPAGTTHSPPAVGNPSTSARGRAPTASTHPSPEGGASSDLARALRLTGEAARAWVSVMGGSSGLHLSAR